ncbi:hypothetical protein BJP34_10550 [Moorena producens PAL-8-15-08-1]|uniref:Uncharacterized protein n=1 Tax=Moorena producens PAL-8-15-08-1 TaxID=1458985 RepID=A0A1D8TQI2_9CYAN|nr:hypothetical protein BJP34_10550 [Moorena producens PAL-8-15-08-1]
MISNPQSSIGVGGYSCLSKGARPFAPRVGLCLKVLPKVREPGLGGAHRHGNLILNGKSAPKLFELTQPGKLVEGLTKILIKEP